MNVKICYFKNNLFQEIFFVKERKIVVGKNWTRNFSSKSICRRNGSGKIKIFEFDT